jgi:plasmid stability protein
MGEQLREGEPVTQPPVVSRTGGIAVRTTERGLPTQLKIGAAEMSRAPEDLAREILSLCQLSAMRLQVARRRELRTRGFSSEVIRGLNLATEEKLAAAEQQARADGPEDDQAPPETWMGSA